MKQVYYLSRVDTDKCNGDKHCENICPTGAIRVTDKKAAVDESRCIACAKCVDRCPEGALQLVQREHMMEVTVQVESADPQAIKALCFKAKLHPEQPVCVCTGTQVKECATAILSGAKTLEDVSALTGVRSGCAIYCTAPVLRLLKAHGLEIIPPKGFKYYDSTPTLWDVPESVIKKYPNFYVAEDKGMFEKL